MTLLRIFHRRVFGSRLRSEVYGCDSPVDVVQGEQSQESNWEKFKEIAPQNNMGWIHPNIAIIRLVNSSQRIRLKPLL
jgi:hypothetical protein